MRKTQYYIDGTKKTFDGFKDTMPNPLFFYEQMMEIKNLYNLHYDEEKDMFYDRPNEYVALPITIDNQKYYAFTLDWLWCEREV